jgi:predicted RNA-binding protein
MQTTNVFIVDTTTFRYHLQYQFAGTGAKEAKIDFNNNPDSKLASTSENNLVSMLSDSQRVRQGDYVVFYLQQNKSEGVYDGKFYGIFKVKEAPSFLDNNDAGQYLKSQLNKSLTFRTLIEPYEVYPEGITEWEALDEIKHIQSPYQMLWSLIYRKLKGNRGNTMITVYESERLFKLLREKNNWQTIKGTDFTLGQNQAIQIASEHYDYSGRQEPINILPRLIQKYSYGLAFESHLQAYIVQNIGRNTNPSLDASLLNSLQLKWLGNEVSCGVGMQRIDVLLDTFKDATTRVIVATELKANEASPDNVYQLQRYVDWLEQYYIPNRIGDIQPTLVTQPPSSPIRYDQVRDAFRMFNKNNPRCLPLKHIIYLIGTNTISFKQIVY